MGGGQAGCVRSSSRSKVKESVGGSLLSVFLLSDSWISELLSVCMDGFMVEH